MPRTYKQHFALEDHLLLPFGTTKKWELSRIKLQYATSTGIHFVSDVPFVHIDRRAEQPLFLAQARQVFSNPELYFNLPREQPECTEEILKRAKNAIRNFMPGATQYEHLFLDIYFGRLGEDADEEWNKFKPKDAPQLYPNWMAALLPIPQVQIYCEDPLSWDGDLTPENNFRVDFAFWTGKRLVAVEIDGNEPGGYANDVRRDRLLRRAGIDLIHILNSEVEDYAGIIVERLLPDDVAYSYETARYTQDFYIDGHPDYRAHIAVNPHYPAYDQS